jgi:hypothetical protein
MKYGKLAFMALAATLLVPAPKAEACFDKFGSFMSGFATMPFMLGAGVATAGFMGSKLFGGGFGFDKLFKGLGKKEKKRKSKAPFFYVCKPSKPSKFMCCKPAKGKKMEFPQMVDGSSYYSFESYSYSGF